MIHAEMALSATAPAEALRSCRCRCGQALRSPESEFVPGHGLCPRCGDPFQAPPSTRRIYCSRKCYITPSVPCIDCGEPVPGRLFKKGRRRCEVCSDRRGSRRSVAQNPSMALIDAELKRLGLSRGDLSQEMGCHRYYLAVAAAKTIWHPRRAEAEKIAARLNIPLPQLLAYTGGTWEDWRSIGALAARVCLCALQAARAANNAIASFLGDFLVAQVRDLGKRGDVAALEDLQQQLLRLPLKRHPSSDVGGGWTRGRPKNPIAVTKMMATKSERGQLEAPPFLDFNKSADGRALLPLWAHLKHQPRPTRKQVRSWALTAAARLNHSVAILIAVWKPRLEARGLWTKVGRKANEERHQFIDELIAAATRTATGRRPRGFWDGAAAEVSGREGEYISGPELRVWYDRHCHGHCWATIT